MNTTHILSIVKKKIKTLSFDIYIAFLTIIAVLFLTSVIIYALRTYQVPEWDEQTYMFMASSFYRLFQEPSLSTPYDILQVQPQRQPVFPLAISFFLMVFGLSKAYLWGLFTNGLFHMISMFGTYYLAKHFMKKTYAFLAAILFAFYGWTLFHTHFTYSETASSASCVLAILFLVKSNIFQNRKYSILFGIFFGLALLTRWVALVFILGPAFYVFYQFIKQKKFKDIAVIKNVIFSGFLTLTIAIWPYVINYYWVSLYFKGHRVGGEMWQIINPDERNPFSLFSLTFYLNSFEQLGIYYFILIVIGIFLAFRKESRLKLILFAIIIPWIFFSFFSILKADRFIIPIYPYIAIISASVFEYIKNQQVRILLFFITIVLSVLTFLGTDWGKGPMGKSMISLPLPFSIGELSRIHFTTISRPPYIYKISGKEIVAYFVEDSRKNHIDSPQVLSLFYYHYLDEPIMNYNLYHLEKPLSIVNFLGTVVTDKKDINNIIKTIFSSDYIIIKSDKKVDNSFPEINFIVLKGVIHLIENDFQLEEYYQKSEEFWIYQDNTEITIYKRKKPVDIKIQEKMKTRLIEVLRLN